MSATVILAYAGAACAGVVALAALWRGRRSLSLWFFAAGMLLLAVESAFLGLAGDSVLYGDVARWQHARLAALSLMPGIWLLFSLSFARGNDREFLRQWTLALAAAFLVPVALACVLPRSMLFAAPIGMDPRTLEWVFQLRPAGFLLYCVFLAASVAVLMNLERTFQAAVGTIRWRIKFMLLGLAVLFSVRVFSASQTLFSGSLSPALDAVDAAALIVSCLLVLRSLFRDLPSVSVFPPRTVLRNSLTGLVAGIYLIFAGIAVKLAPRVQSFEVRAFFLLITLAALTVVVSSDRARMLARRFVSRYFQRPLYDYRSVWRSLVEGIGSHVDQSAVCQTSATLISNIFQVLSVTVWLVDDKRENLVFAGSTSLSPSAAASMLPPKERAMELFQALLASRDPLDFESSTEPWAAVLRQLTPAQFAGKGGNRVCVPLVGAGQLLGFITLADRVGGIFFTLQDFDLLRCVGDQVAAGLLNAHLSHKLLQGRELQAFQTMSAFFVHDLKNTASTLNLMLRNLPVHFDNPQFREDALRGMAKTCDHINSLISRLSLLRHDLRINPVPSDLNNLVSDVLSNSQIAPGVSLVKTLRPCPGISLDKEQFAKVLTNLLINASEAVAPSGEIRVETAQNNGWVVLSVSDNGCGMTPEFLANSLFRPFQTTKKSGLGIGMFQSKMIVEAHGGRIEVESLPRLGATFRVLLPTKHLIQ